METVLQIAAVCLVGAVLAAVLRQRSPEAALLLGLAVCAAAGALLLRGLADVLDMLEDLAAAGGLPPELLGPYRPPENQTGHLGLFNVDTILKKHYGERFGLRLENNTAGGGACIIAVLPAGRRDSQC